MYGLYIAITGEAFWNDSDLVLQQMSCRGGNAYSDNGSSFFPLGKVEMRQIYLR